MCCLIYFLFQELVGFIGFSYLFFVIVFINGDSCVIYYGVGLFVFYKYIDYVVLQDLEFCNGYVELFVYFGVFYCGSEYFVYYVNSFC